MKIEINNSRKFLIPLLLLAAVFLLLGSSSAANVVEEWNQTYGGSGGDEAYKVTIDSQNNIIVTGQTTGLNPDYSTLKYAPNGTLLWNKTYDSGYQDYGRDVIVDDQDNILVSGIFYNTSNYLQIIIKYDSTGNEIWTLNRTIGSTNYGSSIEIDSAGNIIAAGPTNLAKYDSSRNLLFSIDAWLNGNYPSAWSGTMIINSVKTDSQNNIIATGQILTDSLTPGINNYYFATAKFSPVGTLIWARLENSTVSSTGIGSASEVVIDSQDNIIATGTIPTSSGHNYFTIKYDSNGNVMWNKIVNIYNHSISNGLAVDDSNNVLITGVVLDSYWKTYLVKYNKDGDILWSFMYPINRIYGTSIIFDKNGKFIVAGFNNAGQIYTDYYIFKGFWIENNYPLLSPIGNKNVDEGNTISFTISGTDPDGDSITFSASGLPAGANFSGNTFNWTPNFNQAGVYVITFTTSDGGLTDSENVTITVNNVNTSPPILAIIGDKFVNEGQTLQFTVSATDSDGDILTYSTSGGPLSAILNSNTGIFTWTPSYTQAASYTLTFTVSDGSLTDSENINIIVKNAPTEEFGAALAADILITNGTYVKSDVDFDGTNYLVIWEAYTGGIQGEFIDTSGKIVGSKFVITSSGSDPTISFNGNEYLIAYISSNTIHGRMVSKSGTVGSPFVIGTTGYNNLDSSYALNTGKFLVVWYRYVSGNSGDIFGRIISSSGVPEGSEFGIVNGPQSDNYPSVATDGSDFLVTWYRAPSANDPWDVYSARVSSSGTVLDPSGIPISTAVGNQGNWLPASSAFDGQNYLISWEDGRSGNPEVYVARVSKAGVLLDGPSSTGGIPLTSGLPPINPHGVATEFNGTNFVVVWSGGRTSGKRVSATGTVTDTTAFLATRSYGTQLYPNMATDGANFLILWKVSEGSTYKIYAQIVSSLNQKPVMESIADKYITENQNLVFTINAADPDGDIITYSATGLPAGATFTGNSFSWTPNPTQAGIYQVTFTASDGKLLDFETITITVENANQAPVLGIIGNRAVNEGQSLEFTQTSTDQDGDTLTYTATGLPTGAVLNSATGAFTWTPDYTQAGTYTVTFTVSDGSLSDSETIDIVVGGMNRAPILDAVGDKVVNEDDSLSFSITGSDPDGDSVTYSATGLPAGATFTSNTFSWVPGYDQAGIHSVTFTITDAGGMTDTETIIIDVANINRAPIMNSIGNQAVNEGANLQFTVTAADPDGDNLIITPSGLPTGSSFENGQFSWTPGYAQAGTYQVTFTVNDGVLTDSETIDIVVNNVNQAPVLNPIGIKTAYEDDNLSFSVSGSDPDGDGVNYSITGLPAGATFNGNSFSWTPTFDQSGSYTVTFTVSDGSLTDSEEVTINVGNVNRAPVLNLIGNKEVYEGANLSFTITGTDADGDSVTYSATGLPTGASFNGNSFTWTPGFDQAGIFTVTFTVSDGLLIDTETVTITVNNVNRPPVLTPVADKVVDEERNLSFTVSGSDPDGDSVTYSATGLPEGATFTGNSFSWTPTFEQSGTYFVTFTISDGSITTSETISIAADNVNRAPILGAMGIKTVNEGETNSFIVSGSDPDGDSLTYIATGLPSGATFDPATRTFSWTPDFTQAGTYTVTFTVSDGSLTDSEEVLITVNNVNRAPVLNSVGDRVVDEDSNLTFTVSGSDPDGDALNFSVTNLPAGASFDPITGVFSWTPGYDKAGAYTLVFGVSDGSLTDTETVTITVDNVNLAPVLGAIGSQAVNENGNLAFTVSGSDPDGDVVTYTATGLPSGATFDPATGIFSWTPTYEQAGSYSVTFTAGDGSLTDNEDVNINVGNVNRAPVLDVVGGKEVNEGANLSFTINGADVDGDSLTFSATGLPPGASFTGNSFTWTPNFDQAGTYSVTFTVSDGSVTESESIIITVNNVNQGPVLYNIGNKEVDEGNTLSFTLSGTDPDGEDVTYSAIGLPAGATFDPVTGAFSWTPGYDESGTYTITFTVSDGILSDSETITVTVNNLNRGPELAAIGTQTVNEGENLTIPVSGSDPDGDSLTYTVTGLPAGATFTSNTFRWTPDFTQAGTYTVTFTVSDGTLTDTEEVTITVVNVNQAPELVLTGNKEVNENENLSFTVTGTDPDGDALNYSVANLPAGATFDSFTGAFSWTPGYDASGTYSVIFGVSDGTLTDTETVTITVDNVNRAPVLGAIGSQTVNEDENLSFTVSGSDPDADGVTYTATEMPAGATFDPVSGAFSWTPGYEQAGSHTVTFTVSDGGLTDTEDVNIMVSNVNREPVLDLVGGKEVNEGANLSFTITSTDADGDSLTYSATALPEDAVLTGNSFSWTPDFTQAGTYMVTFTVSDGAMSDSESITITVNNINRAPIMDSVGNKAVNEGNTLSFALSGTDPDGDSLTYSAIEIPAGSTFNPATGTFSWTPGYDQSGVYTVTFAVSDGAMSDSESITITVNNINRAPILNAIGARTVGEGQNLNFLVSGTDPDSDSLTYTSSTLPTGATFNGGVFDWTPTYDQAGPYTVTFIVSDGVLSDSETVAFTVNQVNRGPIANAGADVSVNRKLSRTLNGYGSSDPDGDALTYSWTLTKPVGSTSVFYNANTAYPYFTPDLPGEYLALLTVTDTWGTSSTDSVTVTAINQAPNINAGSDQTVNRNTNTYLSGGATDPEGDSVSYSWTLTKPVGSNSVLNNANTASPYFTADLPGEYIATMTVTDQYGASSTDTVIITALNRNPVANAGPDKNGRVGYSTALSGTGSSDPDGDSLTYAWTLTGPTGSTSTLSDSTASQPTFTPDLPGEYVALLIVTDQYGGISTSDSVKVTVTYNQAPVAEAGNSFTIYRNQGFYLYGTGSSDPDGDLLTYYWTLTVPNGSQSTLNSATAIMPYFVTDLPGQYVATLVVTDPYGASSAPDSVVLTAENMIPEAYFESTNVLLEDSVDLDGTMSYDQDGDELTYLWEIIKPTGSQLTLQDPTSAIQTFTPDVAGEYTITLTVTDEYSASMLYEQILIARNTGEIVNSRTGTSYSTIQEAVEDSEEGDTILVANGRYPEAINIEYRNVDLQATGDNVVLDSVEGQPLITIYGGQSKISGFIMTGAYNDAALRLGSESETEITGNTITESYDGIAIDESYIGHVITQNRIINNENNGITGYGIYYTTISGNEISNNGNVAISLEGSSDVIITNNKLTGNGNGIVVSGLDYATISGNNISDNSQGVSADSLYDSEITENIINNNVDYGIELYSGNNVAITRNIITNTEGYGLQFDGNFQDVTLHFNRISGNGLDLYYYNTEGLTLQAENNWWGSNSEPSNIEDTDGLVSYSPWLVLNLSADPEELLIGESSTITADLTQNSDGEDTSSEGTIPDGLEVNFTADLGTIDNSATITDGKATVNYTAQEAGVATVSAATDTEEVVTNIDVTSPNRPPELDLGDETIAEGDTLHLVLDGSDPDGDSITYSISGQPPESSFDGSTGTFTWTPRYDQAGSYTVTFTVSDGSLTTDQTITITVENTNRAPEMQTIGDKSVYEGQAIEFEVEATDPDGTPLTYSLDMLPPGASFDTATGIFTWTPNFLQAGPNLLTFTVTDGELSDSETIHLDVVNVNQAPVLNPVADQTIPEGQILEFTVEGADPDGQALTYTAGYSVQDLIQLGAVFNSETRTFTWTPSFDQAGSYTIPFTVSDGELSDTKIANIVVQNTNRMPTLMAIGNRDAYENQNLQLSVDALDPDGDSLTYSAAGLPTGATFDPATRVFSWTPSTGQSGSYMVTFTVSDGDLSVSETVTINVFNTPSGSGVSVSPVDPVSGLNPVTISFSNVLSGGITSVLTSSSGPEPPAGFITGEPPLYYEISTTAIYQPPITVAIHYDEGMFSDESALRLFHYEDGAWMDITTSQDLANNIIYGSVTSLSPFSIFERTASNAPTAVLDGPYAAYEGSEITFDGSASSDPDGDTLTYEWDLDGDGVFETPGMMVSKTWIDDYSGTVSLKVTDPSGLFSVASSTVTVTNTAPAATLSSSFMVKVPITMRVAGQPGNSVELQIIQEGVVIASKTILFNAGSPNEQQASLLVNIDMSKPYTARLVFNTNSHTSGATPVWLIIDGKKTKVATFKSNPNNPSTWSQTLNIPLKGLFTLANKEITFNAQASDTGVDTITFEWSFGDGTPLVLHKYTSDGTTLINDSVAHTYLQPGVYQLILRVRDDDGGEVTYQMEVRVV